ncbi:hypothetical protein PROFUN_10218 [Planoprotostelium fungivorum]|uniref:GATA-type domain-containing protein n=1 Tax=Planoprotostelium fungivorum TaxID=1890364 RepID=A0A2P6MQ57_9EUKA|nr:hypothetical protein PROFUN_10218 [Planoprotostelium fungivorum]
MDKKSGDSGSDSPVTRSSSFGPNSPSNKHEVLDLEDKQEQGNMNLPISFNGASNGVGMYGANLNGGIVQNPFINSYLGMGNEYMMDPTRAQHRNSFDALAEFNIYRMQQQQMALQQQQMQQPTNPLMFRNDKIDNNGRLGGGVSSEAYQILLEKENRWGEYSELIRRFATEAANIEITKENYYDLYNMAVRLLRSVDSLDPDKMVGANIVAQRKASEVGLPGAGLIPGMSSANSAIAMGLQQADLEFLQARKSFDLYYGSRSNSVDNSFLNPNMPLPKYSADYSFLYNLPGGFQAQSNFMNPLNAPVLPADVNPLVKAEPQPMAPQKQTQGTPVNPTPREQQRMVDNSGGEGGTPNTNEEGEDGRTTKRVRALIEKEGNPGQRRRRQVYASRRNLHCHWCGVTETPEWRRGPAGDHTLCNACGLHHAKSLKKKKKDQEGRKHSIDYILTAQQQQGQSMNQQVPVAAVNESMDWRAEQTEYGINCLDHVVFLLLETKRATCSYTYYPSPHSRVCRWYIQGAL